MMRSRTFAVAWRSLGRNRRRSALAIGAVAVGQLTLVFVSALMAGAFQQMLSTVTGPLVGHVQIHHPDWREERAGDLFIPNRAAALERLNALPQVRSVSARIFGAAIAASGEEREEPADAQPAMIVGLDPTTEAAHGGMLEGLAASEAPGDGGVVIGRVLANRLRVAQGDLLAVIGQDVDGFPMSDLYEVRAVMSSGVDLVNTMGVVASIEDAGAFLAMPDEAHEITVQGEDFGEAAALAETIRGLDAFEEMEVLSWLEAVPEMKQFINALVWVDFILLGIVFISAAAGIANTAMMSTFERTHEFGMLLALGVRPGRIVRLVLLESVLLGLAGVVLGSAAGLGLVWITGITGIDYAALSGVSGGGEFAYAGVNFSYVVYPRINWAPVVYGIVAVTTTCMIASLWPALIAARLQPVEAMRS